MSKTKTLTVAEAKHRLDKAQALRDHATNTLVGAEAHNRRVAEAVQEWRDAHPAESRPPRFIGRDDGRAADGYPADISMEPAHPDETIEALQEQATEAQSEYEAAEEAHREARQNPPGPGKPTGWIATQPKLIDGTFYDPGQYVDVSGLDHRKLQTLESVGLLRRA